VGQCFGDMLSIFVWLSQCSQIFIFNISLQNSKALSLFGSYIFLEGHNIGVILSFRMYVHGSQTCMPQWIQKRALVERLPLISCIWVFWKTIL
jgi:hypothetical protein